MRLGRGQERKEQVEERIRSQALHVPFPCL